MTEQPTRPTVFALHGLGLSGRLFDALTEATADQLEIVPIDLPGFGDTPASVGVSVAEMATFVVERIAAHGSSRWLLLGHSMGAKVVSVVATRVLAGTAPVFGLAGVVLLAGSPPSPEPMAEENRQQMIDWAQGAQLDPADAQSFLTANVAEPDALADSEMIIADLRRCSTQAWRAWLQRGSREDWSTTVGTLDLPALIMAGAEDDDLAMAAQRALNGPVYPRARFHTVADAAHLLPVEQPADVAATMIDFWRTDAGRGPVVPAATAALIASTRTSERARRALAARALADDPGYRPQTLTTEQLRTLQALADQIVPQDGDPIDLAQRVDQDLSAGVGDGWRAADLPPDREAYRLGLTALAGLADATPQEQGRLVAALADGSFEGPACTSDIDTDTDTEESLDAAQLTRWFADLSVDLARAWVNHPATMAAIGFDGFANGGDGLRQQGFQQLSAGERESWEPPSVLTMSTTRRDSV